MDIGLPGLIGAIALSTHLISLWPFQAEHELVSAKNVRFIVMVDLLKEKNVLILDTVLILMTTLLQKSPHARLKNGQR